jgi:hypothetical protein
MAAAARPGPPEARDARVPCPLCGGLIHPIAGKCKHCKADLSAYRATRPAANAPLPALHPAATAGNGPPAPIAHAVVMPPTQAVLPPRPTTRVPTAQAAGSAWRSWPVVVIVVAMMAIVAAVVLMVWPTSRDGGGKHTLQPPPAPERMDTQTPPITPKIDIHPAPPDRAPADPLGGPHASIPAPDSPGDSTAQAAPPDPADADDVQDTDAPGSPSPPQRRGRHSLSLNAGGMLQLAMAARLCRKLVKCGTTDEAMKSTCEAIASMPSDPPVGCPAAERCLRHIDTMGCSSQPDVLQVGVLVMQFSDCIDAMRC